MSKQKKSPPSTRRKGSQWKTVAAVLLSAVVVLTVYFIPSDQTLRVVMKSPKQIHEEEYLELRSRFSSTNVCDGITPVHIWREEDGVTNHHCTGGLFTDVDDNKQYILTCGHAFWKLTGNEKPRRYYYQIIQPYDPTLHPISAVQQIERLELGVTNATKDVAVCIPGESALIAPLENVEQGDGYKPLRMTFRKEASIVARSTVTGQSVDYVGAAKLDNGIILAVIDYSSFEGESGTLFKGKDDQIYILSRTIPVSGITARVFNFSGTHNKVSLCSMVRLKLKSTAHR